MTIRTPGPRIGIDMSRCTYLAIFPIVISLVGCSLPVALPTIAPVTNTPPGIPTDLPESLTVTGDNITPLAPGATLSPATLAPTSTPSFPIMRRLTEPGCCVQPFWSADGAWVRFIDQPAPTMPTGIYQVGVGGGELQLFSERVGLPSPDDRYLAFLNERGETIIQEITSGTQSVVPNGGLRVFFSPGTKRLAWAAVVETGDFDRHPTVIGVSDIDGANARELITIYGGGIVGWLNDDTLMLVGRDRSGSPDMTLFTLSVVDGTRLDLIRNQRILSASIAPGGGWVVYTVTFDPDGAESDGLWVLSTDGQRRYKLEVVGSARWRDGTHLLIIPLEPGVGSHRLWQFDCLTGEVEPLTDPALLPFRVAAGDWSVSPMGTHVVFLNAEDEALWVIELGK